MSKSEPATGTPDEEQCLVCTGVVDDETWAVRQADGEEAGPFCSESCARQAASDDESVFQRFWILRNRTGAKDRRLHSRQDCRKLQNANGQRPTSRAKHPHNQECKDCNGVDYQHGSDDQDHRVATALADHDVTSFEDLAEALAGDGS